MKGFVFTLDAVFALIVASAAIGILAFVHFSGPSGFAVTTSTAYSVGQTLIGTTLSQAALSSQYALAAANASVGQQSSWPYFAKGNGLQSFSSIGPQLPQLLFQLTTNNPITSPVSVDYGIATFAEGNVLYIVNASTGSVLLGKSVQGNVIYPIIYKGYVIYQNSTGYVSEINTAGAFSWNSVDLPVATSPLTISGGSIAFGAHGEMVLLSTLNGSMVGSNSIAEAGTTPAYGSGEYIESTSTPGSQNFVYGFITIGSSLQNMWSYQLTTGNTTSPLIYGNVVVVGSGNEIVGLTLGGTRLWGVSINGKVSGNGAASQGNIYYIAGQSIQTVNISCGCSTGSFPIPFTNGNVTPSVTPGSIYVDAGGNHFISYSLYRNNSALWNITMASASASHYQDVALAYGNAYLSANNTLYVFGTCRALPGASLLQAMASMYLQNKGGCAASLLNSTYNSSNIGIFINGTYAPSLRIASFNGKNSVVYAPKIQNPTASFSSLMWFNYNSQGTIMDIYNATSNNGIGFGQGLDYANASVAGNGEFTWTISGWSCSTQPNSITPGKWYNVAVTVSGYSNTIIYLNGNENAACSLSPSSEPLGNPAFSIGADPVGGGSYGNALISNMQLYSGILNSSQITGEYLAGIGGVPVRGNQSTKLIAWYPLEGGSNDYGPYGSVGYPYNITYVGTQFSPMSLINAFEVSAASFPLSIANSGTMLYNVSVVVWR